LNAARGDEDLVRAREFFKSRGVAGDLENLDEGRCGAGVPPAHLLFVTAKPNGANVTVGQRKGGMYAALRSLGLGFLVPA